MQIEYKITQARAAAKKAERRYLVTGTKADWHRMDNAFQRLNSLVAAQSR